MHMLARWNVHLKVSFAQNTGKKNCYLIKFLFCFPENVANVMFSKKINLKNVGNAEQGAVWFQSEEATTLTICIRPIF